MGQHTTPSERIDELPVLIYWLKQMRVDMLLDQVLGPPHGNWEGLSYGELALVFITHTVMGCAHFLSPVEAWAARHLTSLSHALGQPIRAQDCTDDRLAVVLTKLGDAQTRPGEAIEAELGQHLVSAIVRVKYGNRRGLGYLIAGGHAREWPPPFWRRCSRPSLTKRSVTPP